MLTEQPSMAKLRWIMQQLRDPENGCPWDIKQTFASIVPHTIEEAYEVADAIEQGDFTELEKELGDLLFQVVFYSQLGEEEKRFDFDSVVGAICEKLIRRHPHVFAGADFAGANFAGTDLTYDEAINSNWENEKAKERQQKHQQSDAGMSDQANLSILADIPKNLPALSQAAKIQKRCAHVGFDWHDIKQVVAKVEEEIEEVKQELFEIAQAEIVTDGHQQALAEEIGDLLFAVVNVARHAKQDPESLLRQANAKFSRRFQGVEALVAQAEKPFEQHSLAELDHYWDQVKLQEK